MTDIEKAFEGRWRFKGFDEYEVRQLSGRDIREYCRDFFEAGILLAKRDIRPVIQVMGIETPSSEEEAASFSVSCDSVATEDFETFWNLYDKKVGRTKCENLWRKMTASEKAACIEYVPFYVQAQPDKQYRKNPETFLRNKSWHDEIINRNEQRKPTAADLARKAARILED